MNIETKKRESLTTLRKRSSNKLKVIVRGPLLSMSGYGEQSRFALRALSKQQDKFDLHVNLTTWGRTGFKAYGSSNNIETQEVQWIRSLEAKTQFIHKQAGDQGVAYDVSIQVTIPPEWEKIARINIGYTAGIESTMISPGWIEKCSLMDKIIVVSQHSKYGFDNTVIQLLDEQGQIVKNNIKNTTPIDVVNFCTKLYEDFNDNWTPFPKEREDVEWREHPQRYSTSPYNKGPDLDITLEDDFNLLCIAQWSPRKNLENTIRWFIEEFKDDPAGLVLKLSIAANSTIDRHQTENRLKNFINSLDIKETKCSVTLLHGEMSENQMNQLYTHEKIKGIINLAHGEGFGLPMFEAATHALPVIAPDWSGHLDFLYAPVKTKKSKKVKIKPLFLKVDYDLKPIQKEAVWQGVLEEGSMWCYAKEKSSKSRMRDLYINHKRHRSTAKKLQKHLLENFSSDVKHEEFVNSVLEVTSLQEVNEQTIAAARALPPKPRAEALGKLLRTIPQQDQETRLKILKDAFKGERCFIASCGPSLLVHESDDLQEIFQENVVIAIKQTYDMFAELVDFHVYNCANFKKYDYGKRKPIVFEASSIPQQLGDCDIRFPITERGFENSLCVNKDYEEWTLEKKPRTRPYGPGIMYELVFYLVEHLGFSEVITIGWDNKLNEHKKQHFYDLVEQDRSKFIHFNAVDDNPAAVDSLPEEAKITVAAMGEWFEFLAKGGTELKIISEQNEAPSFVPRPQIADYLENVEVF